MSETNTTRGGRLLREKRHARGWSQPECGEALGVSEWMISHMEAGRRRPGLGLAYRIEDVLGVPMSIWLFDDERRRRKSA